MISIGVIGCGHWGPNHVRIFSQLPDSKVLMCADLDEKRLAAMSSLYPSIQTTKNYQDILSNPAVDAVVVALPTNFHFKITQEALLAGKHVLCEKPLSLSVQECLTLNDLASKQKKLLMVGHIFVFNQGVSKLRQYIQEGQLGKIHYANSQRTNLGPFRYDVNGLWDLAPHDVSIFNYLFDNRKSVV